MTRSNVSYMLRRASERFTAGVGAMALTALMLPVSDARASTYESVAVGPRVTVKYSAEALQTNEGAAQVYRRLKFAARKVCDAGPGTKTLAERVAARACVDESLAEAVRKVDRPL